MTPLQQKLVNMGYKKHTGEGYVILKATNTLYQKRITDEKGTLYFIDIWYYPEGRHSFHVPEGIQIEVQFHKEDESFMHVMLFEKDIAKAEEELFHIWKTLNLGYYEEFN